MQVRAFERYIPLIRNDTSDGMWIADEKKICYGASKGSHG